MNSDGARNIAKFSFFARLEAIPILGERRGERKIAIFGK